MNKKNIGIAMFILVGIIFIVVIMTFIFGKGKKNTFVNETTETRSTMNIEALASDIRIDNFDSLYFFTSSEYEMFKLKLADYLTSNNFNEIKVADIVGNPKSDDYISYDFWIYASKYDLTIKCTYNMDTEDIKFQIEKDKNTLDNLLGIDVPSGDGDPGTEDANTEININNISVLENKISKENIRFFKDEFEKYLISKQEYRRAFTVKENDIYDTDDLITFVCEFTSKQPVNDYNIFVSLYKYGSCDFTIINSKDN